MIFWALEKADDATIIMFGCLVFLGIIIMSTVALVDWIKKNIK